MKTKDLREKSVEELTALLDEQQLNQFRLRSRFKNVSQRLRDVAL